MKVIAFFILILCGTTLKAQTKLPTKVFYAHEYICHVFGGTGRDYVLLLFPDSTVSFSLYMQQTGSFLKDQSKTELRRTGTYSFNGDTLSVRYDPTNSVLTGLLSLDSSAHSIVSRQATGFFLLSRNGENLLPLNASSPLLELTSLVELNGRLIPGYGRKFKFKGISAYKSANASR
ncbi:MAG: hypothetical protein EOP48_23670 [Sphingobacteriales bacterium]|nr:MAG: hypothetical protein EOP48_23670 [Sphingobacteriales bacterium]